MRAISNPGNKAEGTCGGFPYNTELVSCEGVSIHFWLGDAEPSVVERLEGIARRNRDVVGVTYSHGQPSGFWAHSNMR